MLEVANIAAYQLCASQVQCFLLTFPRLATPGVEYTVTSMDNIFFAPISVFKDDRLTYFSVVNPKPVWRSCTCDFPKIHCHRS